MRKSTNSARRGIDRRGDKSDPRPMNMEIFYTLRQRILENKYAKSGRLPAEMTLLKEFNVSRHTMRAALDKLVVDGLIERKRGAGTTLIRRDSPQESWALASLDTIIGKSHPTDVLFVGTIPAERNPKTAKLLGIPRDATLFQVTQVFKSSDGPQAYATLFTRPEFGKMVPRERISPEPFLDLLEEFCGVRATRAVQVASAAMPPDIVRSALGLGENEPALYLRRTFFTRSGQAFEDVSIYCRPDTNSQVVEFFREDDMAPGRVAAQAKKSKSPRRQDD